MPVAESKTRRKPRTRPNTSAPETAAEKIKRLSQGAGPKSYSVNESGESFSMHSIKDLIALQEYCDRKEAANDPCATIIDCEIDQSRPCVPCRTVNAY